MLLIPPTPRPTRRSRQLGIGLVELMVGITVGLIVAAGAAMVATRQINEHRRLMLEVQIQQDLRVAADLIQQDLRRAGFRGLPANGVWEPAHNTTVAIPEKAASANPYASLSVSTAGDALYYQYAKETSAGQPNATNVMASNEQFGIRMVNKTLYLQQGLVNGQPNWQPITDPDAVEIVGFVPTISSQQVSLADLCPCPSGGCGTMPTMSLRRVTITIQGVAKSDPDVKRTLVVSEKIRADDVSGACP